ncbi:MAG: GNAT family N-acetyltransferase [Rubrivivax sp.]|nr:GNAT family N-acetyltransferase [Rubrivivax sp.]
MQAASLLPPRADARPPVEPSDERRALRHRDAEPGAAAAPGYRLRLARAGGNDDGVREAQRLRFEVFNLELGEGLARSYGSGLDVDPFDAVCDHLLVTEAVGGRVVGTYRLQTGATAARAHGYYCEREFDFGPLEPLRARLVELGRACIDARHRNFAVLNLLWRGIAAYAQRHGARWLVGCSSLGTLDEAVGAAAWRRLQVHLAEPPLRTRPHAHFACGLGGDAPPPPIPRLLTAYLALGARLAGPPAIDREFGTIDFLTCLDLEASGLAEPRRLMRFLAAGR